MRDAVAHPVELQADFRRYYKQNWLKQRDRRPIEALGLAAKLPPESAFKKAIKDPTRWDEDKILLSSIEASARTLIFMQRLQIDNETWETNLRDHPDLIPEVYIPDDIQEILDQIEEIKEEQERSRANDAAGAQEEADMLAFLTAPRVKPLLGSEDDRDEL